MAPKKQTWRPKVVEACAAIARHVSKTDSGAAHTVQLMLQNPEFRKTAIKQALDTHRPRPGDTVGLDDFKKLQAAADTLGGYEGRAI